MSDHLSQQGRSIAPRSLGVVPDANVFTDYASVRRLLVGVRRGQVRLYWSPKTLEEVGRIRLWIWIKRVLRREPPPTGSSGWKALWARYSEEAHRWFADLSPFMEVTEDRPPHEPAWAEPHPDPNDAWLWNGARRVRANVVLTLNLRDAPPADAHGVQQHENVVFMHPESFIRLLDVWDELITTGRALIPAVDPDADVVDVVAGLDGPGMALLRVMLSLAANEPPAETGGSVR